MSHEGSLSDAWITGHQQQGLPRPSLLVFDNFLVIPTRDFREYPAPPAKESMLFEDAREILVERPGGESGRRRVLRRARPRDRCSRPFRAWLVAPVLPVIVRKDEFRNACSCFVLNGSSSSCGFRLSNRELKLSCDGHFVAWSQNLKVSRKIFRVLLSTRPNRSVLSASNDLIVQASHWPWRLIERPHPSFMHSWRAFTNL
jgi:hypothetical protein